MFHLPGRSGLNSDTYQLNCDDTFCGSSSIVLKILLSWWLLALQEHLPYADDSTAVTPKSELNGGIIVDTPTKMGLSRWDHHHHQHQYQHHHQYCHHFQHRRQIHQDGAFFLQLTKISNQSFWVKHLRRRWDLQQRLNAQSPTKWQVFWS